METTILEKLEDERIFSVKKLENGNYEFTEECDRYFKLELTAQEVIKLSLELANLVG